MKRLSSVLENLETTGLPDEKMQPARTGRKPSETESSMSQGGEVVVKPATESQPCLRGYSRRALKPKVEVKNERITTEALQVVLGKIALASVKNSHSDMSDAQWALKWEPYMEMLGDYPEFRINLGYQHWMRGGSPFLPTPGELVQAVIDGTREWISG